MGFTAGHGSKVCQLQSSVLTAGSATTTYLLRASPCQFCVQDKAQATADSDAPVVTGASKQWLAPKSLQELFETLEQCNSQNSTFRLIAGNTGAGVYHDWPLEQVLINIHGVSELNGITVTKVRG